MRAAQTPSAVDTVSQLDRQPRADGRPQRHGAASRPAPRRSSVALSRIPGIDVPGPAARARQVPVRLHRADDQPRPAVALLQRRGAAGLRPGRSARSAIACRRRSIASSTCSCPTARSACGGLLLARRRMAAELCARLPAARARPADGGAVRLAAARPDLAQPHGRQDVAQRPGLCLVRAGQGGPRRSRPRPLLPGHERRQDQRRPRLGAARRGAEPGRRARPRAARLRHGPPDASISATAATTTARRCATAPPCWRWRPRPAAARACSPVASAVRERMVAKVDYTTTQEQAWLVLAARAMAGGGELAYSVDGAAQKAATRAGRDQSRRGRDRARRAREERRRPAGLDAGHGARRAERPAARGRQRASSVAARVPDARTASRPISRRLRQNDRLIVSISGRNLERRLPRGGAARPAAGRLRDRDRC